MKDLPDRLRDALAGRAPTVRPEWTAVPAAVLVPLLNDDGDWHVLFTRRTVTVESHRGQVSFPGGRLEPGEAATDGALRETKEELGIEPDDVDVLGPMDSLLTVTQYQVTPIVGRVPWPYLLHPHPKEVARVFHVPLSWLGDPANLESRAREPLRPGPAIPVYYFRPYEGEVIWGATARITLDLLTLVGLRAAGP